MLPNYPQESAAKLPAADPTVKTLINTDTLCQVVDIFDLETSISVQLERLEAKRHRVELLPDEEDAESGSRVKFSKYTLMDSHGNYLFLIFHSQPGELPLTGQYLVIKSGCELRRGILIGTPSTIRVLPQKGDVTLQNKIKYLKELWNELEGRKKS